MVFSFLLFLFLTILAFIFYSGTVFVITGSGYIFIFILIYLLTGSGSSGGKEAYSFSLNADKKQISTILKSIIMVITPILLFSGIGYIAYDFIEGFLHGVERMQEISINSVGQVSDVLFTDYGIVMLIFISAFPVLFIWITTILEGIREREKVN